MFYNLYLHHLQGYKSVHDYTTEFLLLAEQNNMRETENQQMAQYLCVLRSNIWDRIRLQPVYDVHRVQGMALRAEEFDKHSNANNFEQQ